MRVDVTAEDLACGWGRWISPAPNERDRRGCEYCPIEHAATRAMGERVLVNGVVIYLERTQAAGGSVVLPDSVQAAIVRIDSGVPVAAFSFEIERPT